MLGGPLQILCQIQFVSKNEKLPLSDNSANQDLSESLTSPLATFLMAFLTPFPPLLRKGKTRTTIHYHID